jgi:hypothetical protein
MKSSFLSLLLLFVSGYLIAQHNLETVFEKSNGLRTPTYLEGIEYFKRLAGSSDFLNIREIGITDSGQPLHLVVFSHSKEFEFDKLRARNKYFMLVNNAIHAGEPDGVDASMLFLRELTTNASLRNELQNVVIAVIPFYNIGGVLNRNSTTRINQLGPESYGFRGNAQNLDLNRDFMKMDSRNARSFAEIFHLIKPDLFVDNHVSDGADFQHVVTLIATQHNKLGGEMGVYLHETLVPGLYKEMAERKYDLVPYVNIFNANPDRGFSEFKDGPRYSSGYAALFQCFSFIIETHSLKPFKDRVLATYELNKAMAQYVAKNGKTMRELRLLDQKKFRSSTQYFLDWQLNRSVSTKIFFKGYESTMVKSKITGNERLQFDRGKPYEKEIDFYDTYNPSGTVEVPGFYVIPQGWTKVVERLQWNQIRMRRVQSDSSFEATVYLITNYEHARNPYEGHYPNNSAELNEVTEDITVRGGDYIVPTDQPGLRYIMEVLEPQGPDSFFTWNFFDAILQQKEYFSPYIFEELAPGILNENPDLKNNFEERIKADSVFANNAFQQLNFIYQNSKYREKDFMRYPVYKIK